MILLLLYCRLVRIDLVVWSFRSLHCLVGYLALVQDNLRHAKTTGK